MRLVIGLPVLIGGATAQVATFSFVSTRAESSLGNIDPTPTETSSGPVDTGSACSRIADLVDASNQQYPNVDAELAYACLKSVPILQDAASSTISSLKQMLEFQSTVAYLKAPPDGYVNAPVDLMSGLDDIDQKVRNGDYDNEYDFENDIAALLVKAHDGHLSFDGMAYGGVFRWRRNTSVTPISASSDGKEAPKVWAIQDFNQTLLSDKRSAFSQINGKDALQFMEEESLLNAYHDPDTRYNAMFYMQPADSYGYFTNPRFYPGASLNVTFENATFKTYSNQAIILDSGAWSYVKDSDSFYATFIAPSSASSRLTKRSPHTLPRHLENPREFGVNRRSIPADYPVPVIEHSAADVDLAGYFIDTSQGTVGILMAQTFNTENPSDSQEFQAVVQEYLATSQSRNITKHIIDVRNNGGGKILLGYDMYLQFFPTQEPQLMSRYRGSQASDIFGQSISSLPQMTSSNGELYTSPFNFHSYLDKDGNAYTSWEDMYPPATFHNDNFTDLLRYNLSDPYTTSDEIYSIGVTMTGYGDRSNFTSDPFKADHIIILSDGICASTCSLFVELMVQQSGVKTLAVGGRPVSGPMQPVGGTKGSLVLQSNYLQAMSEYIIGSFASSRAEANQWANILPNPFGIATNDASINFQDNIRKGLETDGVPTQFLNDTASCRIWYEPQHYINVTSLWERVAQVAFGRDGGLDENACLAGSVASREAQTGQGKGDPTSGGGEGTGSGTSNASPTGSKGAAAGLSRPAPGGWMAVVAGMAVVLISMAFGASLT